MELFFRKIELGSDGMFTVECDDSKQVHCVKFTYTAMEQACLRADAFSPKPKLVENTVELPDTQQLIFEAYRKGFLDAFNNVR